MPTSASSPRYCAYLLRCWHVTNQAVTGAHEWRFSLEDPSTGARRGFASFETLIAFLHEKLINDPCGSEDIPADEQIF